MNFVDNFLNRTTVYRLMLYYLLGLLFVAVVFGFFGILPYSPFAILLCAIIITMVCWATNILFARVFHAVLNVESAYITALILALIISPGALGSFMGIGFLVLAPVFAMAVKYIFAIGKKHLFNPAACAVVISAIFLNQSATWWIAGNVAFLPFVLAGGILITRKMQRTDLVAGFFAVALATAIFTSPLENYTTSIMQTLLYSPFFFLAFVMLTEPLTTPPSRVMRVVYGAIVGFFFALIVHIGSFYFTPEFALIIGNVFSYIVSPKERFAFILQQKKQIATDAYEFVFTTNKKCVFLPGQYVEWTLGHTMPDSRGNRRYFTIASSPAEDNICFGIKFYNPPSSFKRSLALMKTGDTIFASQLAGSFVLPKDKNKKLVFIAGGIGITPFRSMIQYLLDTKEAREIVLLYSNKKTADIVYKDTFDRAHSELGIKTVYVVTDEKNSISQQLIAREVPDFKERIFYISGPHSMVKDFQTILRTMGVSGARIKTDFFPGFA